MMDIKVRMRRATLEVNEKREKKAFPVHGQGTRKATEWGRPVEINLADVAVLGDKFAGLEGWT
jgi:hypothetical protein